MIHIKKFNENLEKDRLYMSDEEFTKNWGKTEEKPLSFREAFLKYIQSQEVTAWIDATPEGYYTIVQGIQCKNGYKYVQHGGGCSGQDCNQTWILDSNDKIIANESW